MEENQIKGYILEEYLKKFLKQQGYAQIPPEIEKSYNIIREGNNVMIKGRGAKHQIDALGQFEYQIPFVYPIRLLTEAKFWDCPIGIEVIRNFVGVLKDVSENYFIDTFDQLPEKQRSRLIDVAAIFSTSPFSSNAQMYAYAHGIYLVQCTQLKQEINRIYDSLLRSEEILWCNPAALRTHDPVVQFKSGMSDFHHLFLVN